MNEIIYSNLDSVSKNMIDNLNRILPSPSGTQIEVVWLFFKTDNLTALTLDPEMVRERYPVDKYSLTILIPSSDIVMRACADIRQYLMGFTVYEINSPSFTEQNYAFSGPNMAIKLDERLFVFFENKHFISNKMRAMFAEDEQITYRINDNLSVISINNGIIHPLEISETGESENCQFGGVTDSDLHFIPLSATIRTYGRYSHTAAGPRWYVGANPNVQLKEIEFCDEDVVFLGPLSKHYGHFILEGLARLWFYLDSNNSGYKAAYLSEPGMDRFNDVFTFFGIPPENIIRIIKPTAFRTVIVPEQSMRIQSSYHQNYKDTIDRIKQRIPPAGIKKVYFSKEMRHNNRGMGEKIIEDVFVKNGFTIVYPERLSMFDTIAVMKGCETFAASSGTNAHNAIFLNDSATVICLNRSPHLHYVQSMIDRMKNLNSIYVDANVSLLPVNWSVGPFLFGPTRYLISFFNYFKFEYDEQSLYDEFPKYLIEFLKYWGFYYNDDERKGYIEKHEQLVLIDDLISNVVDIFSHMKPNNIR